MGDLPKPTISLDGQPLDKAKPTMPWDGEWEITYVHLRQRGAFCGIARIDSRIAETIVTQQQELHAKAVEHLVELEDVIDKLKVLGPCELDGTNALLNTRQRLNDLADRCSVAWLKE